MQALSALFDDDLGAPGVGDPLPALWHWVALARWSPFGATGGDGHPRPVLLPEELRGRQRMFAGGRVVLHQPLHVGERVEVEEEISSLTPKQGRRGSFVLVELRTRIIDEAGALALEEVRDLVYRDPSGPVGHERPSGVPNAEQVPAPSALLANDADGWSLRTDPVALMRFSSATANGHRIHYDWPYATQVEGYPGLVVHGPLMTLALAEVARLERPAFRVAGLEHRNHRPLFCGQSTAITVDDCADGSLDLLMSHGSAQVATLHCTSSEPG